ncbi:phage antirepressor [Paenibacillus luteus]|uniref:phage antirepressor n=1 Tax=Paenibacillus luteus TaxID=2545753 RepID=UPI001144208F|nr:phage antirepressor KilAC domain-containing protein [Paenibacillus luteus]
MNQLQQLFNYEGNEVRTVLVEGEPWFIAKDVCTVLEVNNVGQALTRLDADEKADVILNDGSQGRNFSAVSESGLYSLILGSRKPQARAFKRWVTSEVLPSIRKTGGYNALAVPSYAIEDRVARAKRWIEEEEARLALELETQRQVTLLTEQAPKISYYERILASHDSLTVGQIAKDYGLTADLLNQILKKEGVQYKTGGQWVLKSVHIRKGYTESKTGTRGDKGSFVFTKWTQKGRLFIHELLADIDVQPNGEGNAARAMLERTKRRSPQSQRPRKLVVIQQPMSR